MITQKTIKGLFKPQNQTHQNKNKVVQLLLSQLSLKISIKCWSKERKRESNKDKNKELNFNKV